MEGKTRYAAVVVALTLGFALFCGGRFSARLSDARPWQVQTARTPAEELTEDLQVGSDGWPDSLLPGEVIDVNRADVYDLRRLPGIGEKRAMDIIAYREEHGPFQTVDELTGVSGIGPGILEGLRDYVTTGNE